MERWVIVLLAAGIALVAASARAGTGQVVLSPTVFASHNLPSNAVTGFTVTCPAGYTAVSAGVTSPGSGSTLLSLKPVGRGFAFRFGNPATNDPTRVTVAVACRKLRGGPVFKLTLVKNRFLVRPGTQRSITITCPPKTTPAGSGFDLDPGRAKSVEAFGGAVLSVRTATASLRALQFRVASAAQRTRAVAVYGNCLTVLPVTSLTRARLTTKISTYTNVVAAGQHHFKHDCGGGWSALGAGYALGSGSLRIDGAAALGAGGRWWLRNNSTQPLQARLQVICAKVD
jgi:hypothetical protein